MNTMNLARRGALGVLAALLSAGALTGPVRAADATSADALRVEEPTQRAPLVIDPYDRGSVLDGYMDMWLAAKQVPFSWTGGNVDQCLVGPVDQVTVDATLDQINFVRALAGSPSVAVSETSGRFQQAALIMDANNQLSHTPPSTWKCWTNAGSDGAQSLLSLQGAPNDIPNFIDDHGPNNAAVGHRRGILNPIVTAVGLGMTPGATAINGTAFADDLRPSYTAWPSAGYFPYDLQPRMSSRWSVSTYNSDWSLAGATVSTSVGGAPALAARVELRNSNSVTFAAPQVTVWAHQGDYYDTPVTVTVRGATFQGFPRTITYSVILTDPASSVGGTIYRDPFYPSPVIWSKMPAVVGSPEVGQTVSVDDGTSMPTSSTEETRVSWVRDSDGVTVGTDSTYTITEADRGSTVTATVVKNVYDETDNGRLIATGVAYTSTDIVPETDDSLYMIVAPGIDGRPQVGKVVTVTGPGDWSPALNDSANVTYQWARDGSPLPATGTTYRLVADDLGHSITAFITVEQGARRGAGSSSTVTGLIGDEAKISGRPAFTGGLKVGKRLTAIAPTFAPAAGTNSTHVLYRWLRNGNAIPGARKSTYTLVRADKGKRISLLVALAWPGHATATATSKASRPVR